jgi:pilus assembly protein CpaE
VLGLAVDETDLPHKAQTVTVVSVRGGSGKTMLATNLGALLASRPGETAALADLNLEFPAAALSLGVRPGDSLAEIVEANESLSDGEFDSMLVHHSRGLRLLSAQLEAGQSERISDAAISAVLDRLGHLYDHVVMDCRPSFRDLYLDIWETCDRILVICPPDVVSVSLTRNLLDAMSSIGVQNSRLLVVLNQVVPSQRLRKIDIDRHIDAVTVEIPYAGPNLHRAEDEGRVFALEHCKDPAARAIRALADDLARSSQVENEMLASTPPFEPFAVAAVG